MDSHDQEGPVTKPKRISAKLIILISVLGFSALCTIIGGIIAYNFFQIKRGTYSIEKVVLTDNLDESGQPVGSKDKFQPSDTIIAWVLTSGAEGIIGMRWYYQDEMIFERFGKTQGNQISTYIESNKTVVLPEGNYRVEIHITGGTPHETLNFTVERYKPEVIPLQPTPIGHKNEETSAFVEVPFVFDEVWTIKGKDWEINEVKIVFLDEDEFVAVVALTDVDIPKLSESQLFTLAKPIAAYVVQEGYLDKAENLKIDGKSYDLSKKIFINLANRGSDSYFYRVEFNVADLLEPTS
jgi:hypothetical protein